MQTYNIVLSDYQLKLITEAMKSAIENLLLEEEDLEELEILVSIAESTPEDESNDPGVIHGWCF